MIADPPSSAGAVHDRATCQAPAAADRPVGAPGSPNGVADAEPDVPPVPTALTAATRKVVATPAVRPVTVWEVVVDPVDAVTVDQVAPPSADDSTAYPVMADPPVTVGAVHERATCPLPAVAASPVGVPGRAVASTDTTSTSSSVPVEDPATTSRQSAVRATAWPMSLAEPTAMVAFPSPENPVSSAPVEVRRTTATSSLLPSWLSPTTTIRPSSSTTRPRPSSSPDPTATVVIPSPENAVSSIPAGVRRTTAMSSVVEPAVTSAVPATMRSPSAAMATARARSSPDPTATVVIPSPEKAVSRTPVEVSRTTAMSSVEPTLDPATTTSPSAARATALP